MLLGSGELGKEVAIEAQRLPVPGSCRSAGGVGGCRADTSVCEATAREEGRDTHACRM